MRNLARYRKALVAVLGALAVIGTSLPPDAPEWLSGACAMATAFGVWRVRNDPPPRFPPPAPTRYRSPPRPTG